jgi:hypothetical protein
MAVPSPQKQSFGGARKKPPVDLGVEDMKNMQTGGLYS